MTPGDRNPARYKKTSRISGALLALIMAGAGTQVIYNQLLDEKEGSRLAAYKDGAGIWTICRGLTRIQSRPVQPTDKLTKEECDSYDKIEQMRGLVAMHRLVGDNVWQSLSPAAQAALTSWCQHNLGETKCAKSTAIRELKKGRRNEACAAITLWIRDGGKDCRERSSGCYGQVDRRQLEDELCLIK